MTMEALAFDRYCGVESLNDSTVSLFGLELLLDKILVDKVFGTKPYLWQQVVTILRVVFKMFLYFETYN